MKKILIPALIAIFLVACGDDKKDEPKTTEGTMSSTDTTTKKVAPAEFADARYVAIGKKMIGQFTSGDINGWLANYSEDAKYRWSAGDSISGKAAIGKYWKDRRASVIDSISFEDQIWLPIKVNQSQAMADIPGVWLLSWYQAHVKYKNGQRLVIAIHNVHHFNANDQIDETVQYMDRVPINKAVSMK